MENTPLFEKSNQIFLREAPLPLDCVSKVDVCLFVCLFVCLRQIFARFRLGYSRGVTLLLTGVLTRIHFLFLTKKTRTSLKIVYGAGGLDWGSQKLLIFAKNEFEIVYGAEGLDWGGGNCSFSPFAKNGPVWNRLREGRRSGLGVPKTAYFWQSVLIRRFAPPLCRV